MTIKDKLAILYRLFWDDKRPKIFSFHDCLPDVFSQYIELLIAKRCRFLGGEEFCNDLGARDFSKKEVMFTFDDGRRNCWTVIYPLLKKYNIRAVFFIIPGRIKNTDEVYPSLEDYWKGKVSWESLYASHRKQPYLTWRELREMRDSGLVDIYSHGLNHEVARVSPRVIDFQYPGVYEMPVYFDEWYENPKAALDDVWGMPIYERSWAPLASNIYMPAIEAGKMMNDFVKKKGGFLFFKKKKWRNALFEYYGSRKNSLSVGHFKKCETQEVLRSSIFESKKIIEHNLGKECLFFSLPLYQGLAQSKNFLQEAGYKGIFTGYNAESDAKEKLKIFARIPGFLIKFLASQ